MDITKTTFSKKTSAALISFICLLAISFSNSAIAASSCKGKSQSACSSSDNCSWTKGYKKKNGSKVAAYCKSKPKKKKSLATSKATGTPKKTTAKAGEIKNSATKTKETKKIIKKKTTTPSS